MNKEILNKYIELIDKGYCDDCNELNCLGNFPHKDIAKNIKAILEENQELKNQQKEFIEWLENWLKILKEQFKGMRGVNAAYQRLIIDTVNETLSKYKEIIGDK